MNPCLKIYGANPFLRMINQFTFTNFLLLLTFMIQFYRVFSSENNIKDELAELNDEKAKLIDEQ